ALLFDRREKAIEIQIEPFDGFRLAHGRSCLVNKSRTPAAGSPSRGIFSYAQFVWRAPAASHDSQAVISQAERRAAPRRQNGMLDHGKLMIEQNPDTAPR
ncbi:hypothetical protein, partial [Mesorhizobium sp.]|uniref:hypothetical protein n=1 Tax=Mesorhizobium sp. TaxID=1871066 RepID=UPI0025EC4D49